MSFINRIRLFYYARIIYVVVGLVFFVGMFIFSDYRQVLAGVALINMAKALLSQFLLAAALKSASSSDRLLARETGFYK